MLVWWWAAARCLCLCVTLVTVVSSTYLPSFTDKKADKLHHKSNAIYHTKRYGTAFRDDWDIVRYLKLFGTDMMLWRCKNAIQPYWDWKPLPVVELYCEVIGTLKAVNWYKNGEQLELGDRYTQVATPHYTNDQYFSRWINFRLKIFNATMADSGIYTFQVTSLKGFKEDQMIYMDISEKKRKKKKKNSTKKLKTRGGRKSGHTDRKSERKRRNKLKSRKKLKRYMRRRKKWDYFSYRKFHNNHVYIEP